MMLKHAPAMVGSDEGPLQQAVESDNDAAMIDALANLQSLVCPSVGVSAPT